jgi:hypothetical protein
MPLLIMKKRLQGAFLFEPAQGIRYGMQGIA